MPLSKVKSSIWEVTKPMTIVGIRNLQSNNSWQKTTFQATLIFNHGIEKNKKIFSINITKLLFIGSWEVRKIFTLTKTIFCNTGIVLLTMEILLTLRTSLFFLPTIYFI